MRKALVWISIALGCVLLASCATTQGYQGATAGGAMGAFAGALIDHHNPWRGALLGGLAGAAMGGAVGESSAATPHYASRRTPGRHWSRAPGYRVESFPLAYDPHSNCQTVRERVWQHRTLVQDRIKEICGGGYDPPSY